MVFDLPSQDSYEVYYIDDFPYIYPEGDGIMR